MTTQSSLRKQFRWRAILIRVLVNAVTLFIVVILTPKVYFVDPTLLNLLVMALMLGILNATLKPIIQFFTLPFIFISYGLIIVLINSLMLWLLSWMFPEALVVDRLFWALIAGALYGIISSFLESLFGLNEPIIPGDDADAVALRDRVDDEAVGVVQSIFEPKAAEPQRVATQGEVTADESDDADPVKKASEQTEVEPQIPPIEAEMGAEDTESIEVATSDRNDADAVDAVVDHTRREPQAPSVDEQAEAPEAEEMES